MSGIPLSYSTHSAAASVLMSTFSPCSFAGALEDNCQRVGKNCRLAVIYGQKCKNAKNSLFFFF